MQATVDLVEKLMEAGFDEDITVEDIKNSIMGMRFAEDETGYVRFKTIKLIYIMEMLFL